MCSKYANPFGTVCLDLHCRVEALPVLLRYPATCTFTFVLEFHDSAVCSTVSLDAFVIIRDEDNQIMDEVGESTIGPLGSSIWL